MPLIVISLQNIQLDITRQQESPGPDPRTCFPGRACSGSLKFNEVPREPGQMRPHGAQCIWWTFTQAGAPEKSTLSKRLHPDSWAVGETDSWQAGSAQRARQTKRPERW